MPQPVPTPTPAELVLVSEITLLDYDTVETMVAAPATQAVADAKWARTLLDIADWPNIEKETGDIKKVGSIEFFEAAAARPRLDARNRIRARYDQPLLTTETPSEAGSSMLLYGISSQNWFGS
jgi:hypothetical protein